MTQESVFFLLDMAGTAAFAVSGAVMGVQKRLDFFGVSILALAAATAGGITRDLLIGNIPPDALSRPAYFITALTAGTLVFFFHSRLQHLRKSILFFDALGLGLFTVAGLRAGLAHHLNPLSSLFLGTLTGIGGGILRDILGDEIPFVLRRELYASLSLAGGLVYLLLRPHLPEAYLAYGVMALIVLLRLISLRFNWHLPHPEPPPFDE